MADIAHVKQGMLEEDLSLYRGFILLCSMIAGMAIALVFMTKLYQLPYSADGIVGYFALGLKTPYESYKALAIVAGGVISIFLGEWLWMMLAHLQRMISSVPISMILKRSAVAFSPLLAYITNFSSSQKIIVAPLIMVLLLGLGFILLALFEKKDKRKIYFAFPTENRYQPASMFTHGSVIVLGIGLGWFLQSLPGFELAAGLGIWFASAIGILVWITSLLLGAILLLLFSKLTFDQVYIAIAFTCMPLALLPLQTLGGLTYIEYDKIVAVSKVAWLMPVLVISASALGIIILALSLIKLRKTKVEIEPTGEEVFRAIMLIIPIPLLLYSVAYWPLGPAFSTHQLLGPIDMFNEGEPLGAAQAILMGRLPFNDILFRHGFIADALSGLAALNWFGGTLESYRLMLSYLAPLGLIVIYIFAVFCMPWLWALLLTLTLLTGTLGLIPYTRFVFPIIGFIFTLFYLQSNRWYLLIFSGVMTALSVIASYTAGVMSMAGQLTLMLVYIFIGSDELKKRLTSLGVYLGSSLLALLPWILYLAMSGSVTAYFENFSWVMSHYGSVFGLPLPGLGQQPELIKLLLFSMPPIVIAIGALISIKAVIKSKQQRQIPWNIILLTVIAGLYWMRFLTRSHYSFLMETLPIAAMLAAFFIFRLTIKQQRLKGVIFVLLIPILLVPQPGKISLKELADGFGNKTKIVVDGLVKPKSLLLGRVFLQPKQAEKIDNLVSYLNEQIGTSETFFDFSNQPLLYFLVPRRPVTRSLSTVNLATFEQQIKAIHQLDSNEVKMVINDGRSLELAGMDQVPCEIRQYAISEYILNKYIPIKKINDNVIMLLKDHNLKVDPIAANAMKRLVNVHRLPLSMAQDSKYASGQGNSVDQFIAKGKTAVEAKGMTVSAKGQGIKVDPGIGQTILSLTSQKEQAQLGNVITLTLATSTKLNGKTAELLWGDREKNEGLTFTLLGDNQDHTYIFRVGGLPSWVLLDKVTQLKLIMPGGGWHWKSTSCLKIKDIKELKLAVVDSGAKALVKKK